MAPSDGRSALAVTASPTAENELQLSVAAAMMVDVAPAHSVSPLIGRAEELDQLAQLIGLGSADPRAAAVLLAGDAGVGKTRLLAELRDRAQGAGWQVLVGHCLDFGDSALPYLPFTEIFGRLSTDSPGLMEALTRTHPAITRLTPGRRLLTDAAMSPSDRPVADRLGSDRTGHSDRIGRGDLLDAVHAALEQLADDAPLLVLIEDVHWADQSTRELLSFFFTRQFSRPVAIAASYRSDDLHRRHPLRATVLEWMRLPTVTRVQLQPLSKRDVRSLIHAIHPGHLRESDVHAIVDRAEGNAFFAEELVVATEIGCVTLPEDLASLLLVRLDRLDDACRMAVRAASGAGRRVTHDLLCRVVDLDASSLDLALRTAVESNVLVAVGADSYAFRHALLAEAVYDDLLPGERVRLHSAYAAALQSREIDGTAAELARHARAAHDLPTAIRASIQAGDEAMAVGGPDEAAQHYELALELLSDDRGTIDEIGVDTAELAATTAEAITAAGLPHRAVALVQDQLEQLAHDAPPLDRARLLLALATAGLLSETGIDTLAATSEALELVPVEPNSALRASVLGMHARANMEHQYDEDAMRWAAEARSMAERVGLTDVAADASMTLAKLAARASDPEESKRAFEKIVAQAAADGDLMAELRGLYHLGALHFEAAELDEALAVFETATARARAMGRPWAPFGLDARIMAAVTAYAAGDWEAAGRIVDVTGQSPPENAEAVLNAVGMAPAAGRGEVEALDLLPHLRSWWDRDGLLAINSAAAAIDLHGDRDDLDAATEIHDAAVETVSRIWRVEHFQARIRLGALLLGHLANAAARAPTAERPKLVRRGADLADAAATTMTRNQDRNRPMGPEGVAWMARCRAEYLRLRWLAGVDAPTEEELVDTWTEAMAAFEVFGHQFEVARSKARFAGILRAVGRAADARELAGQARETARRLRAEPLLRELRTLGGSAGGRRVDVRRDEALTPRELEILALVAQGRSNGDIARQLFISAKTVSVHVSNILAKLGASGRTEAAALARRDGLIPD